MMNPSRSIEHVRRERCARVAHMGISNRRLQTPLFLSLMSLTSVVRRVNLSNTQSRERILRTEVLMLRSVLPLALLVGSVSAGQEPRTSRQLPPPTDVDPKLTEELRQIEQQLSAAILRQDAEVLDRLVAPEFTLRVADVPQSSLPRTMWMDNVKRLKPEPREQRHHAARTLADDLAVVSLVQTQKGTTDDRNFNGDFYIVDFWKRGSGDWRIVARYSSPVGRPPDRPLRQLPPPTDSDRQLTDVLGQLERELNETALHGFKDTNTMERLVSPEFTQRVSDAPERSLPRILWGQPSSSYKIESIDARHYAARKLAEDLAVVSLLLTQQATFEGRDRSGDFYVVDIWKKSGKGWQMIARYSSPRGRKFDRARPR